MVRRPFKSHSVDGGHVDSVCDRVRALDGTPGIELRRAVLLLLGRVPTNSCRIKQNVRPLYRGQTRAFGIPLVPADEHADAAKCRVEVLKSEVPRREIKFLVIKRIVGDVHLAVQALDLAVGTDY